MEPHESLGRLYFLKWTESVEYCVMRVQLNTDSPWAISPLFVLFAHILITERGIMKDAFIRCWHTFLDAMCPRLITALTHGLCSVCLFFLRALEAPSMNRFSQPQLWRHETPHRLRALAWKKKKKNGYAFFVWALGDWMQRFTHPCLNK